MKTIKKALEDIARIFKVSPKESAIEQLVKKWNLFRDYGEKSFYCSINDLGHGNGEKVYGEVPPYAILEELVPECLARLLLNSDFVLNYSNGAFGNSYDAFANKAVVKKTNDTLHEIGHGLWYNLIPAEESDKKQSAINSISADKKYRNKLTEEQIPSMHKEYARLVGAVSGQFLYDPEKCTIHARANDLEELFARNFDYLIKGKPLTALPDSQADAEDFLKFYRKYGIIDNEFEKFYRKSIETYYNEKGVSKIPISVMKDGDAITTELIERIKELKEQI